MRRLLPEGARLGVGLATEGGRVELCAIAQAPRGRTSLQWSPTSLALGDDAGANRATRQARHVAGVHVVGERSLSGLPGFLADSLPDSWGRLLVDRQLRKEGYDPRSATAIERLAIVGERGPGALVFHPEAPLAAATEDDIDLDRLAEQAELVLEGESPELLPQLERAGGSAGGSRPKVWIAESSGGALRSGAHELTEGETGWLVKFRAPHHDPPDVAEMEFAYAQMAQEAGLAVAEARLFETSRGRYFGGRRFDREGSSRRHVLTAAAFLNVAPEEAVAADYVDLLKLTRHITRSEEQVLEAYRNAVFNTYAHNRDDHLKQFAFLRREGLWTRSPAYDLTFSEGPGGEHTLLVGGEGRRPGTRQLQELARMSGIPETVAKKVREEVADATRSWTRIASAAGVGPKTRALVQRHIEETLRR